MHPKRGETSTSVHIPQKENRIAIETIRRLSVLLLTRRIFKTKPKNAPRRKTERLINSGFMIEIREREDIVAFEERLIAIEKATKPTTSSSATTCNRVLTKSPFAPS